MTAAEIRQSFLSFFREKQHTIVPSASLLPPCGYSRWACMMTCCFLLVFF